MINASVTEEIWSPVHLRGREAAWVLSAHFYALLVPLAFSLAVYHYWPYLTETTQKPFLFFIAAVLFAAGAAFEVAQNTMDNWYLTRETPSAQGRSLCDLLFYWCITAGQAVGAVAIAGDQFWVVAIAAATIVALPIIYLAGGPYFAALGAANLLAIACAFDAFGSPYVFMQLLMVGATVYFFEALLRTGAQVLHGFTTVAASSGVWFLIIAIAQGASGRTSGWVPLALAVAGSVAIAVALWPALRRLPPSRRYVSQ
jgi:hypothetical protein